MSAQGRSTARGAYYLFLGNSTTTVILAVSSILIGRLLGPDGYGLYSIALIVPSYAFLAIRLGLDSAVTRYGALYKAQGKHEKAASFVRSVLLFEMLLAVAAILILLPFAGLVSTDLLNRPELSGPIISIAIFSILGQSIYIITTNSFVGLDRSGKTALVMIIMSAARFAASAVLVIIGYAVLGAVLGYAIAYTFVGALSVIILLFTSRPRAPIEFYRNVSTALRYSTPVYVAFVLNGIIAPLQITILALTSSDAAVGGFTAALNISNAVILSLTYPITTSLLPHFTKSLNDTAKLSGAYKTMLKFSALFVVPVALFLIAFSLPLIKTIYGNAYGFASFYLVFLAAIGLLAGFGSAVWNSLLNGMNQTKSSLAAGGAGSVLTIIGSLVLIPLIGVYGAAVSLIAGQALSLVVATRMIKSRLGIQSLELLRVTKIYAASIAAALITFPLTTLALKPVELTIVGAGAYVTVLIPVLALINSLSESEIETLENSFSGMKLVSVPLNFAISYYRLFARSTDRAKSAAEIG
jgi:stage V sporulation protein B